MKGFWKSSILITLLLSSDLGCKQDLADVCSRELSSYDVEMKGLKAEVLQKASNREPASEGTEDLWSGWAEARLKEAQRHIDIAGHSTKIRAVRGELSEIANAWVEFHGFAQLGQSDRMLITLDKIRSHQEKVRSMACPSK